MERWSPSDPDVANTFAQLQAALADRYALERELGQAGWLPCTSRAISGTAALSPSRSSAPRSPRHSARSGCQADVSRPSPRDRKSTRLNSSHLVISYAVFCLKKKK